MDGFGLRDGRVVLKGLSELVVPPPMSLESDDKVLVVRDDLGLFDGYRPRAGLATL